MRMMHQVLSPGVQHAEKADAGAEVSGISRHLQQGFGAGTEQEIIQPFPVLQNERRKVMREREDDVEVSNREQVLCLLLQPLVTLVGLTLWAMSVSAGVIRDGLTAASR